MYKNGGLAFLHACGFNVWTHSVNDLESSSIRRWKL